MPYLIRIHPPTKEPVLSDALHEVLKPYDSSRRTVDRF